VVGEDLFSPASQRLGEPSELGAGCCCGAPVERVVERTFGFGGVVGEVDVADFLFGEPAVEDLAVGVAVTPRGADLAPAGPIVWVPETRSGRLRASVLSVSGCGCGVWARRS
jgi:hypothetical protein